MPLLTSSLDTADETYRDNRRVQLEALAALERQLDLVRAGGGERYARRHHDRGRLLVRERLELLLDRDSPFLELSPLAALGEPSSPSAPSILTGHRRRVGGGVRDHRARPDGARRAMNPYTLKKNLRALDIARANRLPVVYLVESGGADLPTQSDLFVDGRRRSSTKLTQLSAAGIPTIALVFGNSTAGGAYVPGMCDYAVLVDGQAKVFLGGPPLVKMATGEDADDEELGGARDALRGLRAVATTSPPTSATASASAARSWPTSTGASSAPARPARRRAAAVRPGGAARPGAGRLPGAGRPPRDHGPGGRRLAVRRVQGRATAPAWSPAGLASTAIRSAILANHRGVLFCEEAKKASEFILLANQADTPAGLPAEHHRLHGRHHYEQAGIIKDGAKMINAVANSGVPHLTVNIGASYGAGNYGMCGRAYEPRLSSPGPTQASP